jgi:hypothetical protein
MAEQLQWAKVATVQWTAGWQCDCDDKQWRQWAMVGVMIGDSNCGGKIAMGHNSGGAMVGGTVVQS